MDYRQISIQLLEKLGGKENISSNAACMTRLRVGIRDMSRVDLAGVKKVEGVLGVVESNTLQIVFGPGKVNKVLEEFYQLTGLAKGVAEDPDAAPAKKENVSDLTRENKEKQKAKHDKPVQRFLKKIANIFVALLPGIIAAGLINGICNVINVSTDGALSGLWWYECIRTMGWALFAYLPILVGFNAAKEFGGSGVLGAIAGTMSIANTAMPLLATFDDKQITLPFTNAVFNPAAITRMMVRSMIRAGISCNGTASFNPVWGQGSPFSLWLLYGLWAPIAILPGEIFPPLPSSDPIPPLPEIAKRPEICYNKEWPFPVGQRKDGTDEPKTVTHAARQQPLPGAVQCSAALRLPGHRPGTQLRGLAGEGIHPRQVPHHGKGRRDRLV